jgi:nitroreductase
MIKHKIAKKYLKLNDFQFEKLMMMKRESQRPLFSEPNKYLDVLLLSHSIEKGMSLDNPKKYFGEEKAKELIKCLESIDEDCFEYDVGMSILDEYVKTRTYKNDNINNVKKSFDRLKKRHQYRSLPAGISYIDHEEIIKNINVDLIGFLKSRHDIRKTTNQTIKESEIKKAIEIASLAPSACNRQPWKIVYSMDKEKNSQLGSIVSGNKAFAEDMRYYCAIVVDYSYFANRVDEFRQAYLNAGIFLAYFVLALHSLDIGSCIMQFTGLVENADEKSHELLKLKESEQVMAVIGFGRYPDRIKCSKAARRLVEDISSKY